MLIRSAVFCLFLIFVAGCSIFGGKEEVEPPAPLVEFTPTLTLETLWTANIGKGIGKNYLKLTPAFVNNTLFIASPGGLVSALSLSDGTDR